MYNIFIQTYIKVRVLNAINRFNLATARFFAYYSYENDWHKANLFFPIFSLKLIESFFSADDSVMSNILTL